MKIKSILSALSLTLAVGVAAQENPLWMRHNAISPDGTVIAFSYKGDIFTVPVSGGKATQLTTNAAQDSYPVWSPDSKQIVFASAREGGYDLYIMSRDGGTPAQGCTKQQGIDEMIRHFGISLDETMSFGDGGNDIPMIQHAAIGVAMGNALDSVKAVADYITDTVDNDGVAKALRHYGVI